MSYEPPSVAARSLFFAAMALAAVVSIVGFSSLYITLPLGVFTLAYSGHYVGLALTLIYISVALPPIGLIVVTALGVTAFVRLLMMKSMKSTSWILGSAVLALPIGYGFWVLAAKWVMPYPIAHNVG